MKPSLQLLQRALIYVFILTLPLQVNHTFFTSSPQLAGRNVGYLYISLYLSDILLVLLLSCSILNRLHRDSVQLMRGIKWLILAIIGLTTAIYVFIPRETSFSGYFFLKVMESMLVFWLFAMFSRGNMQKFIFNAFSISGLVQALIAISQFILQKSIGLNFLWESPIGREVAGVSKTNFNGETIIRSYGLFFHPNQLGIFLVVACATTFYFLLNSESKKARFYYALTYFITLTGLFLTFSRASLLALGVSTAVISALYIFKCVRTELSHSYIKRVVTGVWIVIALASLLSLPMLMARTSLGDKSVTERIDFNRNGIELIQEKPIFGHGIGNMLPAIYKDRPDLEAWEMQPPHSYFIVVACETGLLGMLLIVLLFGQYLRKLYLEIAKRKVIASYATIYLAVFIGFVVTMFFDHYFYHLQQTQILLWMIIGLGAGLRVGNTAQVK
jgi:O-antigen ligase